MRTTKHACQADTLSDFLRRPNLHELGFAFGCLSGYADAIERLAASTSAPEGSVVQVDGVHSLPHETLRLLQNEADLAMRA